MYHQEEDTADKTEERKLTQIAQPREQGMSVESSEARQENTLRLLGQNFQERIFGQTYETRQENTLRLFGQNFQERIFGQTYETRNLEQFPDYEETVIRNKPPQRKLFKGTIAQVPRLSYNKPQQNCHNLPHQPLNNPTQTERQPTHPNNNHQTHGRPTNNIPQLNPTRKDIGTNTEVMPIYNHQNMELRIHQYELRIRQLQMIIANQNNKDIFLIQLVNKLFALLDRINTQLFFGQNQ